MLILGISAYYHDSAAALVCDGHVLVEGVPGLDTAFFEQLYDFDSTDDPDVAVVISTTWHRVDVRAPRSGVRVRCG